MKQCHVAFLSGLLLSLLVQPLLGHAEEFSSILFEDDFSGEKLKPEWGSWKSESVVRDGHLVGITPTDADHPSVNSLKLPPLSDLEVKVNFKFAGSKRFNIMFRDLDYKGSHAGHICHVSVGHDAVTLYDGKTGIFLKELRDKRKAGIKLDKATQEMLKTKSTQAKIDIDPTTWHELKIRIEGDTLQTWIDGNPTATLQSTGFSHPTKSNMNITTIDREVHYDNFSVRTR